ncbi:hypothetical protein H0H92_006763 [Tricholoma furcatifolium]|nr:hypothetical protein H0H92_006763 [Tricholoma furcatifolium]
MPGNPHLHALLTQWKSACANFDVASRASIVQLVATLEQLAQDLARDEEIRVALGSHLSLWTDLRKLWQDLSRAQLTFWDVDDEENEGTSNKEHDLRTICGSLAKFTRNLVAGVPENQVKAYDNEPDMRRLLHYHTSWSSMEADTELSRVLAQAISNMVTTNETLMSKLWETYLNLPEDQVVLITMLTRTAVGARVCVSLLDDMVKLYEAEESSVGAQAFDVGYDILTQLIEQGLVPDLYGKFAIQDEIITPHQTTLLKIVDSYLQSIHMNPPTSDPLQTIKIHSKLSPMLATCFLDLSAYARRAVQRSIRPTNHSPTSPTTPVDETSSNDLSTFQPPQELDVMLPKVCEALVLVTQCMVTIVLQADGEPADESNVASPEHNLKAFFNETRSSDGGIVESLIEVQTTDLLRLLDVFLPRINFGKPVSSMPSAQHDYQKISAPQSEGATDPTGFQYLKRDLVRLLGILSHGVRAVQDQVRICGGIPVVMNQCVIDERNPWRIDDSNKDLREHAIFTLHCLLKDNPDNQAVVDAIRSPLEQEARVS